MAKGLNIEVKGNILTITCDLSKKVGTSKSGNSTLYGTTSGNIDVPGKDGFKMGINIYKPS